MSVLRNREWSTTGLIESITGNAMLPLNQATFGESDLMRMMNEVTENKVVPYILGLDQNYFLKTVLVAVIQSDSTALSIGSAGTSGSNVAYQLPADAVGKKLVNVSVVNNTGGVRSLPEVTPFQVGSASTAFGFWIQGDELLLYPANQFNNSPYVQIVYPAAPLRLCNDTGTAGSDLPNAVEVQAVNYTTGVVTVGPVMPGSFSAGAEINFLRHTPTFATSAAAVILSVAGFDLEVDPTLLVDAQNRPLVVEGDWVANLGYSPFLQLPAEGRNLVTQATIAKMYQALGDDRWKDASAEFEAMKKDAIKIFSPRVNDSPKVLSTLGRGVGAWRRSSRFFSR